MSMFISLVGIPTQARMGVGRVTFLSIGPMKGQYFFLMAKYNLFMDVFYSVIISTDSVSYCLKMSMHITLVGTLTQTRMEDFL